jgi:lysophospholipase L1-like esterase
MTKIHLLLLSLFLSGIALADDFPPVVPMPNLPEPLPSGSNSALYPTGKFEWFQRVHDKIESGKQLGDDCQVIFDGDSITDFWETTGKDVWTQRFAKYHAFDFGFSGDLTQHVLWRLSQGQAQGMHPKLIVLLIGTNNIGSNTAQETADAIKAIINAYQDRCPDAVILLQAVFPRGQTPTDPGRIKINQINDIISKFDDGKKVIYADFGSKLLQPDGTLSTDIMPDFLHPSAKGYQVWADALQPFLDQYVSGK